MRRVSPPKPFPAKPQGEAEVAQVQNAKAAKARGPAHRSPSDLALTTIGSFGTSPDECSATLVNLADRPLGEATGNAQMDQNGR